MSGVDVATVLLDFEPTPTYLQPPRWIIQPPPAQWRLLADSVWERATEPTEIIRTARAAVRGPQRALDETVRTARSIQSIFGSDAIAPRTSLNTAPVGRNRRFDGVRVSFDDVRTVRRAFGGTINDVVLTGVAGGLQIGRAHV